MQILSRLPSIVVFANLACIAGLACGAEEVANQLIRSRDSKGKHPLSAGEPVCIIPAGQRLPEDEAAALLDRMTSDLVTRGVNVVRAPCTTSVRILIRRQRVEHNGRAKEIDVRLQLAQGAPQDDEKAQEGTPLRFPVHVYGAGQEIMVGGTTVSVGLMSLVLGSVLELTGAHGALNEALAGDARGFNIARNPYWNYFYHYQTVEARIEREKGEKGSAIANVLLFSKDPDVAGAFALTWDDFVKVLTGKVPNGMQSPVEQAADTP